MFKPTKHNLFEKREMKINLFIIFILGIIILNSISSSAVYSGTGKDLFTYTLISGENRFNFPFVQSNFKDIESQCKVLAKWHYNELTGWDIPRDLVIANKHNLGDYYTLKSATTCAFTIYGNSVKKWTLTKGWSFFPISSSQIVNVTSIINQCPIDAIWTVTAPYISYRDGILPQNAIYSIKSRENCIIQFD